ncbi:MAG TPA: RHS repeat-associated core domain-containing protein [Gammaproteobacteria bacterium]
MKDHVARYALGSGTTRAGSKCLLALLISLSFLFIAVPAHAGKITRYVHTDHLGNPVAKTDSTGVVIWRQSYTPYGESYQQADPDGPGFTGHRTDADTGLVYMQARYYDPQIGRFLSVDPVMFSPDKPQQFNRYWYANGNPYLYIDPDGREVYVAWHTVEIGNTNIRTGKVHTFVKIVPKNQDAYKSNPLFRTGPDGKLTLTIGGGPNSDGNLQVDFNRPTDTSWDSYDHPDENQQEVEMPDTALSEDEWISSLIGAGESAPDNKEYDAFPDSNSEEYNSNSATTGVLQESGVQTPPVIPVEGNAPGYHKPLPIP